MPILAERALSQNTKIALTTVAVPQQPQPPPDELILPPVLVPKLQMTKPQPTVPYHATPVEPLPLTSTATDYKSEPLSLEMFNCTATDLNEKGVINIKRYIKNIFTRPHIKMNPHQLVSLVRPTNNFAMGGVPMHLARILLMEGQSLPKHLFLDVPKSITQMQPLKTYYGPSCSLFIEMVIVRVVLFQ